MKKTIIFLVAVLIGDLLCAKYCYDQSALRFLALLGFLIVVFSVFMFSVSFAVLFENKNDENLDKMLNKKTGYVMVITLILLIGIHVWGFIEYDKYQTEILDKNGIYTETVIFDKTWEGRGKGDAGYYVHYEYLYKGKKYLHDCKIDSIEIGDTIRVKFLPENPDNHSIIKK